MNTRKLNPERLRKSAPLEYAPENELGVVFLFSHLIRKFGLSMERVQAAYPDALASRNRKRVRIEFEYRSRNFAAHGHDPKRCDWIVCWIHDWPRVPKRIRVVELRKEFGLGFNVWFQPVSGEYRSVLTRTKFDPLWSVPSQATKNDLILFYRTSPDSFVRDVFRLAGPVEYVRAGWKPGNDWMGPIRRVCTLKAPIHLSQLREHRVVKDAGFVRGSMRCRFRATEYWPELFRMIVDRNRTVRRALVRFEPSRVLQ